MQPDQNLHWAKTGYPMIQSCFMRTTKTDKTAQADLSLHRALMSEGTLSDVAALILLAFYIHVVNTHFIHVVNTHFIHVVNTHFIHVNTHFIHVVNTHFIHVVNTCLKHVVNIHIYML